MTVHQMNLKSHELIGLKVLVESSDPGLNGVMGIVRDETRNTITVETVDRILTIPKKASVFIVEVSNGERVRLTGAQALFRPEDRVKRGF